MSTVMLDVDQQRQERLARLAQSRTSASSGTPATRSTRRHPAKASRITALALSVATTVGLSYFFASADHVAATSAATLDPTASPANASSGSGTGVAAAAASPPAAGGTGSGSFTGSTVSTRFGPVQVSITVANGQLTDVTAVQTPGGRSRSVAINAAATPVLRQEALQAQSATIDTVSGATYTSTGYVQSLQSAIDQARSAGVITTA